ncbi:MAG: class I SAM-dependent methyltransferase [Chloroflexi bacterium CFX4]|nr:class I SAM-dependent methyltransferase [Chloroflexi bacterium CFX4]MDL1924209.1 class I SAM-dependent methyltransferase [Chloroflexi bacterium CFX3]
MAAYTESPRYRRCQALFDQRYPNFVNAGQQYTAWLAESIRPESTLLDVGCGRDSLAAEAVRSAARSVGIDLVADDLRHNHTVQLPILANAYQLPFRAESFDVIASQWVVEHFPQPLNAFREMARLLRPDGKIILLTTNAHNYVPFLSRLVPEAARTFALTRLLRRPVHESHPTFYRANTRRALSRAAEQAGLRVAQIAYVGNPFYMAFSLPLFRLALLYERLTDAPRLNRFKLYLIARLEKMA